MKFSISIKTKDRADGRNYLVETLQNLDRAGLWADERLCAVHIVDSGSENWERFRKELEEAVPFAGRRCEIAFDTEKDRTLHQTAREAIRAAAEDPVDWVLVLEDDLDFCADFLGSVARWLEQHAKAEFSTYCFGANWPAIDLKEARGETSWRYPIEQFYGAQALAWRRQDAERLAEWLGPDPSYNGIRERHHDLLLQEWAKERDETHFLASVPSFVQHIGRSSSLGNIYFRFRSWPGRGWRYEGRKPRVLWVGDATVSTGFSRCTHAVCDHLAAQGWEVDVLAVNYNGDTVEDYPYRKIFVCKSVSDDAHDHYGADRLPVLLSDRVYDLVVLLTDPWCVPEYTESIRRRIPEDYPLPPIVGWHPVDAVNMRGDVLNRLDAVATFTEFAAEELKKGGHEGEPVVVPLGIDHDLYAPRNVLESRAVTCPPEVPRDAFVVGVVCRNQYRKRIDLALDYFAEWIRRESIENAYLFLYCADLGSSTFVDIPRLANYHGLDEASGNPRAIWYRADQRFGMPEDWLSVMYSSLDVLLSTSQGEGWGLPVLEAMACGVPCVVGDWAGLGDWPGDAVVKIACTSTSLTGPLDRKAYAIGGIPDRELTIQALDWLYRTRHNETGDGWPDYRERGLAKAAEFSWQQTAERFEAFIDRVLMAQYHEQEASVG